MKKYHLILLITSIIVWYYMVKLYVIMFAVFASLTIIIDRFLVKKKHILACVLNIMMYVVGFFGLRNLNLNGLTLPVGYSVFAFSAMSYIADQSKEYRYYSLAEILIFLFFFPKSFAGPIEKIKDIVNQVRISPKISRINIYSAIKLFIFASFCKYVVADSLYILDSETYRGLNAIMSVFIFAIAFYLDFYAYSLYAIGLGKLLGISLSDSFFTPYKSRTLKEFWSRWNITLGIWLKDYIYKPLGGSRKDLVTTALNIAIVFAVSAIWHSFTLPFLIWGCLHTIFLCLEKRFNLGGSRWYQVLILTIICTLWQLFKLDTFSDFMYLLERCTQFSYIDKNVLIGFIIACTLVCLIDCNTFRNIAFNHSNKKSTVIFEVCCFSSMLVISLLYPHSISMNFFYLRF